MKKLLVLSTLTLAAFTAPSLAQTTPTAEGSVTAKVATTLLEPSLQRDSRMSRFRSLVSTIETVEFKERKDARGMPVEQIKLSGMAIIQGDIACGNLTVKITKKWVRSGNGAWGPAYAPSFTLKYESKGLADYCQDYLDSEAR